MHQETISEIVNLAEEKFAKFATDNFDDPEAYKVRGCLGWALCTLAAMRDLNVERRAILQAGTAYWSWDDESPEPGHATYGYKFEEPNAAFMMERGMFPEMHVWVAWLVQPHPVLIDLSVRYQRQRAMDMGMVVPVDVTWPDYIARDCVTLDKRPCGNVIVRYYAEQEATMLAMTLAQDLLIDYALRDVKQPAAPFDIVILDEQFG